MKTYDLAFSMGFSCGGSRALRGAGLQYASFPLDWIGAPGIVRSAQMVADDFRDWFNRDDLALVDVRRGRMNKRVYRNERTGFGFPHDFSLFTTFDEDYPAIAEKYARRIARFKAELSRASSALVVYLQRPIDPDATDAELKEAHRLLSTKYPNVAFDLLYFHPVSGSGFTERKVAPGVESIGCEYRMWDHGALSHEVEVHPIGSYLKMRAIVPDRRSPEEKAAFAAHKGGERKSLFAHEKNPILRWWLGIQYKRYRKLERILTAKNLLPREHPLWF